MLNTQNTTGEIKFLARQINKNLHEFTIMVNRNILIGHSVTHLSLTPGQIFWSLGVNIRIKLRKKLDVWACVPAFSQRAG